MNLVERLMKLQFSLITVQIKFELYRLLSYVGTAIQSNFNGAARLFTVLGLVERLIKLQYFIWRKFEQLCLCPLSLVPTKLLIK